MAKPKPVPPYLRLVLPSACWNASKIICCFSGGMPMPVSRDRNGQARNRWLLSDFVVRMPAVVRHLDLEADLPFVRELERVREQILDDLLQPLAVGGDACAADSDPVRRGNRRPSIRPRAGTCVPRNCANRRTAIRRYPSTTVPDSIFDRSRMSLISISKSLPEE